MSHLNHMPEKHTLANTNAIMVCDVLCCMIVMYIKQNIASFDSGCVRLEFKRVHYWWDCGGRSWVGVPEPKR